MIAAFSVILVANVKQKQDIILKTPGMSLAFGVPLAVDGWKLKRARTDTSTKLIYENSSMLAFGKPCTFTFDFRPKASQVRLLNALKSGWSQMKPNPKYLKLNWQWNDWIYQQRADGMSASGIKLTTSAEGESVFVVIEGTYPGPLDKTTTSKLVVINNKLTRGILPSGKIKAQ